MLSACKAGKWGMFILEQTYEHPQAPGEGQPEPRAKQRSENSSFSVSQSHPSLDQVHLRSGAFADGK